MKYSFPRDDYNPSEIEPKLAQVWQEKGLYRAIDMAEGKKSYLLIEFPYPSGERLHVGHARSYSCLDALARKRRMQGENVMFPFGWDAFGLPAENFAIKTGIHPALTTKENIANAKKQAIAWGLSFDWSREVDTTDPQYYRWTQWIFLQLFKNGLAFKDEIPVNWCPSCQINLANEEVVNGHCERCDSPTTRRLQSQWLLRITKYASRLLCGLDTVNYRPDIKRQQVEWIGEKKGIVIKYLIEEATPDPDGRTQDRRKESEKWVEVFTTRPDTNFGATFIVLAPEHELTREIPLPQYKKAVDEYVKTAKRKSELERIAEGRKKTGVFTGRYAVNQLNGYHLPIWVSDFVLVSVGTGALVGVPGHDRRDFAFAKEFGLEIKRVVIGLDEDTSPIEKIERVQEETGRMINSGFLDGMDIHQATSAMIDYIEEKGWGKRATTYHLRDWVFSRQHYWGEPIPVIYCQKCASQGKSYFNSKFSRPNSALEKAGEWAQEIKDKLAGWYPVPEEHLPIELPAVEKYQPTDTGHSPLANIPSWTQTSCPACGAKAERETDTMPNWAGSSWYFLRYCDAHNNSQLAAKEKLNYWLPVDWYNGGMEHTTLHLLYSRFWHKFLFDLGVVPTPEPYAKRTSHGVVLGPDGRRMSKSRGNVINPDTIVAKYGADSLRLYEMFIGPFDKTVVWNDRALTGVSRFLKRIWDLSLRTIAKNIASSDVAVVGRLSKLMAKVDSDLEKTKFNTAVAAFMEFTNFWEQNKDSVGRDSLEIFLKILAPLAPFITEELWQRLRSLEHQLPTTHKGRQIVSIHQQPWPKVAKVDLEEKLTIVFSVDGKPRAAVPFSTRQLRSINEKELVRMGQNHEKVRKYLVGKTVKRVVSIPDKIVNFVT